MIAPCVSYWMTARDFREEGVRRLRLGTFTGAAARRGYRGRITLDWDDLHGRRRHLVRVSIYP